MPKLTLYEAYQIGRRLGVNFEVVPIDVLRHGIHVEMEHRDVIGNSALKAGKIALAHLREFPDYYEALDKMESMLKERWRGRRKPRIYLNKT